MNIQVNVTEREIHIGGEMKWLFRKKIRIQEEVAENQFNLA